jgi:uncharacterized protein (TIGR02145 family)
MKKRILVVLFALALSANLRAQVTIGGLESPKAGALLDLNSTTTGGLVLSNVTLDNLRTIPYQPDWFPGIDASTADTNEDFKGAMVYHTGGNNIPVGIYVWNGKNWTPITENCLSAEDLTLSLSASSIVPPVNTPVSFNVSTGASNRCADEETYTWSVTQGIAGTDYDILGIDGDKASIQFITAGTYKVTVVVGNPYSTGTATAEKTVLVGGAVPTSLLNHVYGIVGETCLDVKKNKQPSTQSQEVFDVRIDAFLGNSYEKTYKFVHGGSYSGLSLSYEDDPNTAIIAQIIPPAVTGSGSGEATFTVKFKQNVKNLAPDNGDSLTVKLLASYKDSGGEDKLSYLEIRVEDGTCVCPAKISATEWLNFMCHNLGAAYDILSPYQLITRAHHGDWYRFGATTASRKNIDTTSDNATGWDNSNYTTSGDWPANGTPPCPLGWRLPTNAELAAAINRTETNGVLGTVNNAISYLGTWGGSFSNFSVYMKVGDHLYLPVAGYRRQDDDGSLGGRGSSGYYRSSSGANGGYSWYASFDKDGSRVNKTARTFGFSVRCVSAE